MKMTDENKKELDRILAYEKTLVVSPITLKAADIVKAARKEIARFKRETGVHMTVNHTGKMSDTFSLSTSCRKNRFCIARSKNPESICYYCYANAMLNQYSNLEKCVEKNFDILTTEIIPFEAWPYLYGVSHCRLEAFGDLENLIQAYNYVLFARKNPETMYSQMTKNGFLLEFLWAAGIEKPANFLQNESSEYLNTVKEAGPNTDRIFTVFDHDGPHINCGARHCATCLRCYKKPADGVDHVGELLKINGRAVK